METTCFTRYWLWLTSRCSFLRLSIPSGWSFGLCWACWATTFSIFCSPLLLSQALCGALWDKLLPWARITWFWFSSLSAISLSTRVFKWLMLKFVTSCTKRETKSWEPKRKNWRMTPLLRKITFQISRAMDLRSHKNPARTDLSLTTWVTDSKSP